MPVRGQQIYAISTNQHTGTRCREACHTAVGIGRSHRDDFPCILEVVVIGVLSIRRAIARREHKHRAHSIATVLHALAQSLVGKGQRGAVEVVGKRIDGTPAVVADIKLVLQAQCLGNLVPSPLHAGRRDLGVRRDADNAGFVVLCADDNAGHRCAVEVAHRVGGVRNLVLAVLCVVHRVIGLGKVNSRLQVRVGRINAVIDHANRDTRTTDLAVELVQTQGRQVPLRRLQWVCDAAIELTQAQRVATQLCTVGSYVEVIRAVGRRRDQHA